MKVAIKDLVDSVKERLTFPKVAMRILKMFESDELSAYQLAKIVSLDPILAAYILKVSNSAFYNFPGKVKTLSDAITLIGFEEVKKIVIMISAKNAFKVSDEFDKILWEHSLAVAVACSVVNYKTRITEDGVAYISGLLHDIGKIVFKKSELVQYNNMLKQSYEEGEDIKSLEEDNFGYNHADVGGYILERWNFDQEIIDAVAFHHLNFSLKKTSEFLKKAALVNFSDFLVNELLGIGRKNKTKDESVLLDLQSARVINFTENHLEGLIDEVERKFTILASTMEENI